MFTVSVGYARLVEATLKSEGLRVELLLKELGLSLNLFEDPAGCRVNDLARLISRAVVHSGNPDIGLKAYGQVRPGIYDVVGYVMMSSPTMIRALEHLVRFGALIDNGMELSLQKEGRLYRLRSGRYGESEGMSRQFYDIGTAALLSYLRWMCGNRRFKPVRVEFKHAKPADIREYARVLQCPLQFDSPSYSILFEQEALDAPLSTADEALASMHERFAVQRLNEQCSQLSAWRVQQLIIERLTEGEPTIEDVSTALCVSKRTLQRCLKKEGTQFKELLNDTRRQQAHLYLRHSHFSLQEVAYLLGFHEHSSFFRACSRWFGMTPGQYRADREGLLAGGSAMAIYG